ncbi:hypothetical protein HEP87_02000 [Streptomyces sp. S1D4-11]|nr:hypothetical protein [Streptomyces sp. S1D4-11]QIY93193.1 hypothetical protein HEP87_02000 [Streptomyces sp. S1D4-11]
MPQHNPYSVPVEPGEFMPVQIGAWQNGYDAGISTPPDVPPTPLVRNPDYAQAWAQGAVAGNADGRSEGWRWAYFDGTARPSPQEGAGCPYGPRDSGEPPQAERADYAQSWPCVGELPLQMILAQFAPGGGDENGRTGRVLAQACADKGISRLHLPVSLSSSGSPLEPAGDPLGDAGYWHGTVTESPAEAGDEAFKWVTSRVPRYVGLVRYVPAAEHHFFDLIPEGSRLPAGH